jgi:peptidoglycan/LPS O-acetylase OafA/YrhL
MGVPGGFVGVDVFFVISGFLITGNLARDIEAGRFSFGRFLLKRTRRLMPTMLLVVAVTILLASLLMIPADREDMAASGLASLFYVANVYFWKDAGYFSETATLEPFLHMWSLAVEEQFYLAFPPALVLLCALGLWRHRLPLLLLGSLLSFALAALMLAERENAVFYLLPFRMWEFGAGALLALLPRHLWERVPAAPGMGLGLVLVLLPCFVYSETTLFPGIAAAPPVLGTVLLIACGGRTDNIVSRALTAWPARQTGRVSYAFYLWHWPVVVFLLYGSVEGMSPLLGLWGILISLGLAVPTTILFEEPLREGRFLGRTRSFLGTGALSALGLVLLAGEMVRTGGAFGRPPSSDVIRLSADVRDPEARACHFVTPERIRTGKLCALGAQGTGERFILLGDSHAHAIRQGVDRAGALAGFSGWQATYPGLNILPTGGFRGREGGPAYLRELAEFAKSRGVDRVLVHAYWLNVIAGETYRHSGLPLSSYEDGSDLRKEPGFVAAAFREMSELFPDADIYILGDVPSGRELHALDHARAAAVPWRQKDLFLPDAERLRQREATEPPLRAAAGASERIHFVRLDDVLCPDGMDCHMAEDGVRLYRDGDHLTEDAARLLVDRLGDAFEENAELPDVTAFVAPGG